MKQAKNKIKNYINISNIVTKDEGATDEELKLKRFLRMVKESNSGYDYIFVGTEAGEFVMVPDGELGSNYDPRKRGWYQQGIGSSSFAFTDAYKSTTGDVVISIVHPVKSDGSISAKEWSDTGKSSRQ